MVKKILARIGSVLVAILLIVVFYVSVILGHPQQDEEAVQVQMDQPLLAGSTAMQLGAGADITPLLSSFPAPVLYSQEDLLQAASYDVPFEGGYARVADLTYQTEGFTWQVRTIYPARALSLVEKGDWRIVSASVQTVAGQKFVRMENAGAVRLHAQGSEAVYVITLPKEAAEKHQAMLRTLQLPVKEGD